MSCPVGVRVMAKWSHSGHSMAADREALQAILDAHGQEFLNSFSSIPGKRFGDGARPPSVQEAVTPEDEWTGFDSSSLESCMEERFALQKREAYYLVCGRIHKPQQQPVNVTQTSSCLMTPLPRNCLPRALPVHLWFVDTSRIELMPTNGMQSSKVIKLNHDVIHEASQNNDDDLDV